MLKHVGELDIPEAGVVGSADPNETGHTHHGVGMILFDDNLESVWEGFRDDLGRDIRLSQAA